MYAYDAYTRTHICARIDTRKHIRCSIVFTKKECVEANDHTYELRKERGNELRKWVCDRWRESAAKKKGKEKSEKEIEIGEYIVEAVNSKMDKFPECEEEKLNLKFEFSQL